jgi:hypothetical protein
VAIELVFDEMSLDITIEYEGEMIDLDATRPTHADMLKDGEAVFRLSCVIVRHHIDRMKTEIKEGKNRIYFHFDH